MSGRTSLIELAALAHSTLAHVADTTLRHLPSPRFEILLLLACARRKATRIQERDREVKRVERRHELLEHIEQRQGRRTGRVRAGHGRRRQERDRERRQRRGVLLAERGEHPLAHPLVLALEAELGKERNELGSGLLPFGRRQRWQAIRRLDIVRRVERVGVRERRKDVDRREEDGCVGRLAVRLDGGHRRRRSRRVGEETRNGMDRRRRKCRFVVELDQTRKWRRQKRRKDWYTRRATHLKVGAHTLARGAALTGLDKWKLVAGLAMGRARRRERALLRLAGRTVQNLPY
jgi:hypothetical protein